MELRRNFRETSRGQRNPRRCEKITRRTELPQVRRKERRQADDPGADDCVDHQRCQGPSSDDPHELSLRLTQSGHTSPFCLPPPPERARIVQRGMLQEGTSSAPTRSSDLEGTVCALHVRSAKNKVSAIGIN